MEDDEGRHSNGPVQEPKIVIIGAGISGVAAGKKLVEEGFTDFKILEASNRIGGRIWSVVTDEEGHNKAEMGANWIHGVENNPIYQIAEENNLLQLRHKDKSLRSKDVFVSEQGMVVNDRLVKEVDLIYGLLITRCESFYTENIPTPEEDDSVGNFLQRNFDEKVCRFTNGERHVRELIFGQRKLLECCISGCDNLEEVALQDFGSYESLPGIHYTIPPGFDTVLDILCKDIPKDNIVFDTPVRCVSWDRQGGRYPVCVETEGGEKYYADHVIVTVSLGVLQAACDRMFSPALPQEKLHAINALGYGIVDKVFLEFDQPIVDADVFRLNILWDDDAPHEVDLRHSWYRKIYSFEVVHEHILVGWLSGKEALFMESLTEEQIGEDLIKVLKKLLKKDIPAPTRVLRTKWGTNRLTRGSYSFIKVGSGLQDVVELSKPLKGKGHAKPSVLFGGEATHPAFYSTTHGALLTGYREANRLVKLYHPERGAADSDEDSDDNEDTGIKFSF